MSRCRPAPLRAAPSLGEAETPAPWPSASIDGAAVQIRDCHSRGSHRRPDRLLGRARRDACARGVRRRRHQGGVDSASRRHPVLGRHAQRCRRLVGVRLGVPRHEHQQAFGHTGFGVRGRPSAVRQPGGRSRRRDREFLPAGDGPLRAHCRRLARRSTRRLVVARMPAFGLDRSVARPGRVRADHGADRRPGLGDRIAGGSAGTAAEEPAIRWPVSTRHSRCWRRCTSPSGPVRANWSSCR